MFFFLGFFSRNICSHIFLFCFFSEHLFSYRFFWVFCCRITCSHIDFSGFSRSISSHIFFFSGGFPEHLFSYRFFLFFSLNTCSHIAFFWGVFRSTCSHIVFSSVFVSEPLFSYRFFFWDFLRNLCTHIVFFFFFGTSVLISFFSGGGVVRRFCSHIVFDWFILEHLFYFWKSASFLAGLLFSEHVLPGYKFVSSSLLCIGARVLILETCIVLAVLFRTRCSQATSLYHVRLCLSKHVLLYWKLGVHIFLLDVYPGGFPQHLFSYRFFWGFYGASFLILEVCIVLAAFSRACVPRLQVCIVFSWLISKSDRKKNTYLSQVTDTLYHIILYRVRFEVTQH